VHEHLRVLRRLAHAEGYALDDEELHHTTAQFPETVSALISAACTIAATDAQIATLTAAANLLCDVLPGPRPEDIASTRERLDQVADELARALAEQDKARARLRRGCDALANLGTGLVAHLTDNTTRSGQPTRSSPTTGKTGAPPATDTPAPSTHRALHGNE
jgi:uncharacterized membrane protein YccC